MQFPLPDPDLFAVQPEWQGTAQPALHLEIFSFEQGQNSCHINIIQSKGKGAL